MNDYNSLHDTLITPVILPDPNSERDNTNFQPGLDGIRLCIFSSMNIYGYLL